jgi:hypothetical protein
LPAVRVDAARLLPVRGGGGGGGSPAFGRAYEDAWGRWIGVGGRRRRHFPTPLVLLPSAATRPSPPSSASPPAPCSCRR